MKNTTKKMLSTVFISTLLASPVFAEKGHEHADKNQSMGGGMMMGMMSHDQMMEMHEHMQKMHSMMEKIQSETDPEKHQKLMAEHMQAMQEGMHMMNKDMGMKSGTKKSSHKGEGMRENMGDMDVMKRMDMMEERMGMMQMMMGQMMEHESETERSVMPKYKK